MSRFVSIGAIASRWIFATTARPVADGCSTHERAAGSPRLPRRDASPGLAALRSCAAIAGILVSTRAAAEEVRLVVLHTTDLHGALTAYDYANDRPAARGLVKLATLVDSVRAQGVPTLLVDAGDAIEGSPLETLYQTGTQAGAEDPIVAGMNLMKYDAMAVGNHEFDFGIATLERARQRATFPWLAANITRPDGSPAFPGTIVKTVGPLRVGIVGLCTPGVTSWMPPEQYGGDRFGSPVEAARREVQRLRGPERCDVVVVVAHTGLERDTAAARGGAPVADDDGPDENWGYRLMTQVPGVDVVILGHTHVVVPSVYAGRVIGSQAGKWAENLGRVDLTLARARPDTAWAVVRRQASVVPVLGSTPERADLAALAAPAHERVQAALAQVVGQTSVRLDAPHGRMSDNRIWRLLHRTQLEAAPADVSLASLFDPGVRIDPGPITLRQAFRIYPYQNTLSVVRLSGRQLARVLEHSAGTFETYLGAPDAPLTVAGRQGFNYDGAAGVTYELDLTRQPGQRVTNLKRNGSAIGDDDSLRVAVNSYRRFGGGGFPELREAPLLWQSDRPVRDLLVEHLRHAGTIGLDGGASWVLIPDYVATAERPVIERLVLAGITTRDELARLGADEVARRGDLAYWLARAFGWREQRRSLAFPDVPDSLAPWLDGLLRRKVLGELGTGDRFQPKKPLRLSEALDWCERAARRAGYDLLPTYDAAFRRGALQGIAAAPQGRWTETYRDTLTRAQALAIVANTRFPEVRVLETTDFHGAILGGVRGRRPIGGSAVLAAYLARLTSDNPEGTVLVDGGDCFQGTMISNLQFGRPVVEQMNALRYSATVVGNHEFDWGPDTLVARVRSMKFAALAANMIEKRTGRLPPWARADTTVTRRGVRVGILGLAYRRTPSVTLAQHVARFRFEDDAATAARVVPILARASDIVIAVGHIPAESDSMRAARSGDLPRLAREVPGVAAWLGGHSHNLVSDRINGVPVMIAGSHGEAVAVCDLVVDPVKNRVLESRSRLVLTYGDEVTPDSAMAARVVRWNALVGPIAAQPLGRNLRLMRRNRGGEGAVGNLVTDAIRSAAASDIALQNSGGLRADLPEGTVTRGAIYEIMPFENTIVTMDLTGDEVRLALEQALRADRVTQVSGIRYAFSLDRPPMSRVLWVRDSSGVPLDSARVYRVAVNNFMATGGDDYDVLRTGRRSDDTQIPVRDVLEKFVAERARNGAALDYQTEGRIVREGRRPERTTD